MRWTPRGSAGQSSQGPAARSPLDRPGTVHWIALDKVTLAYPPALAGDYSMPRSTHSWVDPGEWWVDPGERMTVALSPPGHRAR